METEKGNWVVGRGCIQEFKETTWEERNLIEDFEVYNRPCYANRHQECVNVLMEKFLLAGRHYFPKFRMGCWLFV